ncbi:MAG: hypothetical protein WBE76_01895 [Terracidiphilus sp.]
MSYRRVLQSYAQGIRGPTKKSLDIPREIAYGVAQQFNFKIQQHSLSPDPAKSLSAFVALCVRGAGLSRFPKFLRKSYSSITMLTSGAATAGPELATNYTNGYYAAGLPITEYCNAGDGSSCTSSEGTDYLFIGVLSFGEQFAANPCTNQSESIGCAMGFTAPTSGVISSSATPNSTLPVAGGPSGVVIDYSSNIYFSTLYNQTCSTSGGTGGCAVSATQAGLQ